MRSLKYQVHWDFGPERNRNGSLVDLLLDIPFWLSRSGLVPPLAVLNQIFRMGNYGGGMSPGASWPPFEITQDEYEELIDALKQLDFKNIRRKHPYVGFTKVIIDPSLEVYHDFVEWLPAAIEKYKKED